MAKTTIQFDHFSSILCFDDVDCEHCFVLCLFSISCRDVILICISTVHIGSSLCNG
jgi:hypothetical protein